MSTDPFPERIDVRKLFNRNGVVEGSISLLRLPRLGEYLSNQDGLVEAALRFGRNEENRPTLKGSVKASVNMLCQRCLNETQVNLESGLNMLISGQPKKDGKERESFSGAAEVIEESEDELDILALLEDELILSLPAVVYHEQNDCNEALNTLKSGLKDNEGESGNKAFAGLAELKKELEKDQ